MLLSDMLAGWAGVVLSLALEWSPKVSSWFLALSSAEKKRVTAGLIVLVGVVVGGLSCVGWIDWLSCDAAGLRSIAGAIFAALVGNQSIHPLTKRPSNV